MEANPGTLLAKSIGYMRELVRNKNSQGKEVGVKGLFDHTDIIW